MVHGPECNCRAELERARIQCYLKSRLKMPYNFPVFGCFFQFPPESKIAGIIFIVALNPPQQLKSHMLAI